MYMELRASLARQRPRSPPGTTVGPLLQSYCRDPGGGLCALARYPCMDKVPPSLLEPPQVPRKSPSVGSHSECVL